MNRCEACHNRIRDTTEKWHGQLCRRCEKIASYAPTFGMPSSDPDNIVRQVSYRVAFVKATLKAMKNV